MRCCVEDEGLWPFGVVLRGKASNRPLPHWLKTVVVSDVGKGVVRGIRWGSGRRTQVIR